MSSKRGKKHDIIIKTRLTSSFKHVIKRPDFSVLHRIVESWSARKIASFPLKVFPFFLPKRKPPKGIAPASQPVLSDFCKENQVDLVVIGPEQPLVDGLADILRENKINVFGPNKYAAMIEGDKSFSKECKYLDPSGATTSLKSLLARS